MKYLGFKLSNYKGINEALLPLRKENNCPVCLLGMNEAGKTTFLKGIDIICNKLCQGKPLRNGDLLSIRPKGVGFTGDIKFEATIEFNVVELDYIKEKLDALVDSGEEEEQSISIEDKQEIKRIKSRLDKYPIVTICFSHTYEHSEFKHKKIIITNKKTILNIIDPIFETIEEFSPEVLYRDDILFRAPKVIRFARSSVISEDTDPENGKGLATDKNFISPLNKEWQNIFSDLLSGATDGRYTSFQEDVVDWLDNHPNDTDPPKQRLSAMNYYINQTISAGWHEDGVKTFNHISITKDMHSGPDFDDYCIELGAGQKSFQLSERSKGCQWYFSFKLLTEIRASRSAKGFIFLLDEPASNMHIDPLEKIFTSLTDLVSDDVSVIYSTHAPSLAGVSKEHIQNTFLVLNRAKETDSSGSITIKNVEKLTKAERKDRYVARAILPLLRQALTKDVEIHDTRKAPADYWDLLASRGGSMAKVFNTLAQLFEFIKWGE